MARSMKAARMEYKRCEKMEDTTEEMECKLDLFEKLGCHGRSPRMTITRSLDFQTYLDHYLLSMGKCVDNMKEKMMVMEEEE